MEYLDANSCEHRSRSFLNIATAPGQELITVTDEHSAFGAISLIIVSSEHMLHMFSHDDILKHIWPGISECVFPTTES